MKNGHKKIPPPIYGVDLSWLCYSVDNKRSNISAALYSIGPNFFVSIWAKNMSQNFCQAISAIWQGNGLKIETKA